MKNILKMFAAAVLLVMATFPQLYAQAYNAPLTIQALNHTTTSSAISRSMGGLTLSSSNDVSTMFSNPAALQTLAGIQFSIGGIQEYKKNAQSQQWYKLDWMPLFDLFMEGKTADLPDPVIDPILVPNPTYRDTLPRNGRNPSWSRKKDQFVPALVFAAVPFKISGKKFTAGAGVVEYANVDYYYANRTAFNRNLDYITLPISTNPNPVSAYWWGDTRSREGSVYGYGGALAAAIAENLAVGVSGLYLSGTIEDHQSREGYGRIEFFSRDFRYTPDSYVITSQGTSEVSGLELSFSSVYRTRNVMFGLSLKPPAKINRDFTTKRDSTHGTTTAALPENKGSDDMTLPWRGALGVGIAPRPNVFIGFEYEYNPYGSAEYSDKNGTVTRPWLDGSNVHLGLEYLPASLVSVRLGYQIKAETFEPQGNALYGDPISYTVYSAGVGIRVLQNIQLNIGYEYMNMHYEDNWNLNTNVNKETRNTLFSSISYTLK